MTPSWVAPLEPSFRVALRAIERTQGFALHPVQVSGPDVGNALAAFLDENGHRTRIVEPIDDHGWRVIVASIVDPPASPDGAIMVIGARRPPLGIYAGLRLLNQRRDSIVEALACPLLWCGPLEFLNITWDGAPDFWSIRAMALRIESQASMPPESPLWAGVIVSDAPERLREMLRSAREQKDARVSTRIAIQLVEALLASGEYDEAAEMVAELRRDPSAPGTPFQHGTLELLRARAALARGETDEATRAIEAAEALARAGIDHEFAALLATAKGNVAMRSDVNRAAASYEEAIRSFHAESDKRNEAVATADLGVARLAQGNAEEAIEHLETALPVLREVGDERNEARCMTHLGRAHAALHDSRMAIAWFEDALERVRFHADKRGEARILCHLARVYLNVGDAEKAVEDATRALALARDVGDERSQARASEVLTRAGVGKTI